MRSIEQRMKSIMIKLKPYLYYYFRYIVLCLAIQMHLRIILLVVYEDLAQGVGI